MNQQRKYRNGVLVGRGIQWTDFTDNVLSGCFHNCSWLMPNGERARCYARSVALGVAQEHYPEGFEHHYYHPERLKSWERQREPAKIFVDSMADLFGVWIPRDQIAEMLTTMAAVDRHTFQSLTKNPRRILDFVDLLPSNLWVGASSAPDMMWEHVLTEEQKARRLVQALETLAQVRARTGLVTWMSFEPLSHDVSAIVEGHGGALAWAVIGAASNGAALYQPNPEHVLRLLDVLDRQRVPVFFKGNLAGSPAARPWREFWPNYETTEWNEAPRPDAATSLWGYPVEIKPEWKTLPLTFGESLI
jgi:protein gp37